MFESAFPPASLHSLAVRLGQSGSSALPSLVRVSGCAGQLGRCRCTNFSTFDQTSVSLMFSMHRGTGKRQ